MSNSTSSYFSYLRPDILQSSRVNTDNLALDSLQNDFYQSGQKMPIRSNPTESASARSLLPQFNLFSRRPLSKSNLHSSEEHSSPSDRPSHHHTRKHSSEKHSSDSDKSSRIHKRSRRSDRLFDKDSDYQARQARKKHFSKYERYKNFKDGTKITRESVIERLPESKALTALREKAKVKEGASKEEKLASKEAKTELEMYYEANYRRVLYHGDKGLIAYTDNLANKAKDNSVAQDAKNKCGHFKHIMGQIAGYGFNNGYSVVMGWMTSPGHRAELLKLSNDAMGASQVNVASTINFANTANV